MTTDSPLRILVVDDTALYRKLVADAASAFPGVSVVGQVGSGELALTRVAAGGIDLVLLDVVMPGLSGTETFRQIKQANPDISVVLVSGVTGVDAATTVKALEEGALDFIPKPQCDSFESAVRQLSADLRRVFHIAMTRRTMAATRLGVASASATPLPASPAQAAPPAAPAFPMRLPVLSTRVELVVIGVSTGGPKALAEVLPRLPGDLPCPVLVVQHMPPLFTASLAAQLSKECALAVREAGEGEKIGPGCVWIAPGGSHLVVRRDADGGLRTSLNQDPPVNSCRPSVDVLFRSVALQAPNGVLAVILTGMGEDGAAGVAALKARGARCLAQNEKTCVVYGMPQAVVSRGLADEVLPLNEIGPRIAMLAKGLLGRSSMETSRP